MLFLTDIQKALYPSIGRNLRCGGRIDVYQDITVMFCQKAGGLDGAHVIVCVDAAYVPVFPLNGDNGKLELCQLLGGNGMA